MTEKRETWVDPSVAEVRAIREAHAKKFNYDVDAIFEDLKRSEEEHRKMGFEYVNFPPKRLSKLQGTP